MHMGSGGGILNRCGIWEVHGSVHEVDLKEELSHWDVMAIDAFGCVRLWSICRQRRQRRFAEIEVTPWKAPQSSQPWATLSDCSSSDRALSKR